MKFRTLLVFLLAIVAGLQQTKAQEDYACWNDYTLTFYYDNLRSSRAKTGYTFDISSVSYPDWKGYIVLNVVFDPSFASVRPTTTSYWFDSQGALKTITGLEYLNTSEVTNMSHMFSNCKVLTSLDLSSFNTAKVTSMGHMFHGCEALTSLDLSSFNTAEVTYMKDMFSGCKALTSLDLSSFNTAKAIDISFMFYDCSENYLCGPRMEHGSHSQKPCLWHIYVY